MSTSFSIADYFKDNVTLPEEDVVLYLDGAAAWKAARLRERMDAITNEQESLGRTADALRSGAGGTRGIAEPEPEQEVMESIQNLEQEKAEAEGERNALLAVLHDSGIKVRLRAMYPAELNMLGDKGSRLANERMKDKDKSDADKDSEKARVTNAVYLEASVTRMTLPNGDVTEAPIKYTEFLKMADYVDSTEFGKLIDTLSKINTRAAIRDAEADAGFPGRRAEQTGE